MVHTRLGALGLQQHLDDPYEHWQNRWVAHTRLSPHQYLRAFEKLVGAPSYDENVKTNISEEEWALLKLKVAMGQAGYSLPSYYTKRYKHPSS
jgi:hypothetical protein